MNYFVNILENFFVCKKITFNNIYISKSFMNLLQASQINSYKVKRYFSSDKKSDSIFINIVKLLI